MLAAAPGVYDVPVFQAVKVHRDFHAEVAKALYSLPAAVDRTHVWTCAPTASWSSSITAGAGENPSPPTTGARSTDRADLPEHKAGYALRDLTALIATRAGTRPQHRDLRRTHPR